MIDVLLIALVIVFFFLAELFVRGWGILSAAATSTRPANDGLRHRLLRHVAALLAYLVWALIAPEDLQ